MEALEKRALRDRGEIVACRRMLRVLADCIANTDDDTRQYLADEIDDVLKSNFPPVDALDNAPEQQAMERVMNDFAERIDQRSGQLTNRRKKKAKPILDKYCQMAQEEGKIGEL